MAREERECERCGNTFAHFGAPPGPAECAVCEHLGDRSLVWLLKDPSPERLALFRAAPPGWLRFQRETGRASQWHDWKGDPRHERR